MIVRTVMARCDNEDPCPAAIVIPDDTSQPFRFLTEHEWGSVAHAEGVATYCPKHKETT